MSCAPTKHILLDFEGVVSAERRLDAPNSDRYRVTSVHLPSHGEPFTAVVDDVVIARLNALAQLPGVTIHWLTCVGFHVPRSIAPALGFDDFPNSVHASDVPGQDGWAATNFAAASWWKAVAAPPRLTVSSGSTTTSTPHSVTSWTCRCRGSHRGKRLVLEEPSRPR